MAKKRLDDSAIPLLVFLSIIWAILGWACFYSISTEPISGFVKGIAITATTVVFLVAPFIFICAKALEDEE